MHKSQLKSTQLSTQPRTPKPRALNDRLFRYILNIQNRIFVNDFNKKVIVSSIKLMIRFVFCLFYGKSGFDQT